MDAATLTGAIVVALGHLNVGLFANNDAMRDRVLDAAKAEGERMWPMPLEDDYKEYLKSAFADLGNIGGRWGRRRHRRYVPKRVCRRQALGSSRYRRHCLYLDDSKPYSAKGPTGMPVRTLVAPRDGMERLGIQWGRPSKPPAVQIRRHPAEGKARLSAAHPSGLLIRTFNALAPVPGGA